MEGRPCRGWVRMGASLRSHLCAHHESPHSLWPKFSSVTWKRWGSMLSSSVSSLDTQSGTHHFLPLHTAPKKPCCTFIQFLKPACSLLPLGLHPGYSICLEHTSIHLPSLGWLLLMPCATAWIKCPLESSLPGCPWAGLGFPLPTSALWFSVFITQLSHWVVTGISNLSPPLTSSMLFQGRVHVLFVLVSLGPRIWYQWVCNKYFPWVKN